MIINKETDFQYAYEAVHSTPNKKQKKNVGQEEQEESLGKKKKKEQLPLLSHAHNEMQVYAIFRNKQKLCA